MIPIITTNAAPRPPAVDRRMTALGIPTTLITSASRLAMCDSSCAITALSSSGSSSCTSAVVRYSRGLEARYWTTQLFGWR